MRKELLELIRCPNCEKDRLSLSVFSETTKGNIENGVIKCSDCKSWFRIDEQIADLLPLGISNTAKYRDFAKKWNLNFSDSEIDNTDYAAQKEQINFFVKDSINYDKEVLETPIYQALDRSYLLPWIQKIMPEQNVLVIAGGTGREATPIAKCGAKVVCIDISEEMLRIAIQKAKNENVNDQISFILADAQSFPFISKIFDATICYGSLHHLPNPEKSISEAGRVSKQNSRWLSLDPHKSPVRFVFDFAMKINKLYDELANDEPLFTFQDLNDWGQKAGFDISIKYSTYILPHMVKRLNAKRATSVLKFTDNLFNNIPVLNKFAGVIISEGLKK